MNPYIFEEQYHTFHAQGFAHAPGGGGLVGKVEASGAGEDFAVKK